MQPLAHDDPHTLGPYRLLGRLGSGGMGRVYLGRSAGGRTVAVKAVHAHFAADDQFRARFRREVEAARRVGGSWTAPVLDAGPDDAMPWVATGYVAGPALSSVVEEFGPLPERSVRALGAGLAESLEAVHGLGLVHRDVKPSNVLLPLDGPRLIDFGIARATDGTASLTATGVSVGSPGYMAPEQILGRGVSAASDVFSLGAVLVFAAAGQPPFRGETAHSLLYQVVNEEAHLYGLNGDLRDLAAACLAKDPAGRPGPRELAHSLARGGNAASLVHEGWLPQNVVEQISRGAVELLDLEAQAPEPGQNGSGLVTVIPAQYPDHPAAQPPGGNGAGHPGYGFGPAPGAFPTAPGAADNTQAPPPPSTTKRFEAGIRSHRLGCTVVLSVAGALAAGMLGLYLGGVLTGDDSGGGASAEQPPGHSASTTPSSSPSSPSASKDGGRDELGEVPAAFKGTWKGQIIQQDGTPNGDVKAIVTGGKKGAYVARFIYTVAGVSPCYSRAKLTAATDRELTLVESTDPAKPKNPLCSTATSNVTLTTKGSGQLRYRSDDDAGGNPRSTLAKSGG